MSTLAERKAAAYAAATVSANNVASIIAASGEIADVSVVVVPVQFNVALAAQPGTSLTTEQLAALALKYGLEIYP